jgi:hypothetical protein
MATNGTTQNSRQERTYDFKPVDYDINNVEPDAAPGEYEVVIDDVKIGKTSKDSYPMLIIEAKLTGYGGDDPACEKSVGASLSDFLVFFPEGHKGLKMGKMRMRQLNERLGVDNDVVPTSIRSKADLQDYAAALKGQTCTAWVVMETDKQSSEEQARIKWKAPRGSAAAMSDIHEDEEQEAPAPRKPAPKKPAAKGGRR